MRFLFFCLIFFISYLHGFDLKYLQKIHSTNAKGEFIQQKHLKHFNQILQSSGEFEILDNSLIWIINFPILQKSKITKDGIYIKTQNGWQELKNNYDKELILNLMTFDFDAIKEQFDTKLIGDSKQWKIILKPKNIWLKKIFDHILISGKDRAEEMVFYEINGDKSITKFKFNK
ncbi:LolA family protein [Campylobacter vicugnae]|uniref:LolA family protein n=1 Tax=Campylobacter vicugnae TaxID=1660076 RepID=UPI00254DCA54|nr:hypothetical protein [Campylobacter ovis]MDL0096216.1 hypothetical protein [Campylobacter ovis]